MNLVWVLFYTAVPDTVFLFRLKRNELLAKTSDTFVPALTLSGNAASWAHNRRHYTHYCEAQQQDVIPCSDWQVCTHVCSNKVHTSYHYYYYYSTASSSQRTKLGRTGNEYAYRRYKLLEYTAERTLAVRVYFGCRVLKRSVAALRIGP